MVKRNTVDVIITTAIYIIMDVWSWRHAQHKLIISAAVDAHT